MKMVDQFIKEQPDSEPLSEKVCSAAIINEYTQSDAERAITCAGTIVYDYSDPSPFYDNSSGDIYIDEKDLIELSAPSQISDTGNDNEPRQRRYFFSPLNLPYCLE